MQGRYMPLFCLATGRFPLSTLNGAIKHGSLQVAFSKTPQLLIFTLEDNIVFLINSFVLLCLSFFKIERILGV